MIIGIWRAKRNPSQSLDAIKKFQHDYVVKEMQTVKGCLGVLNFQSDDHWGTIQIWESIEADDAEDDSRSPSAFRKRKKRQACFPTKGKSVMNAMRFTTALLQRMCSRSI